MNEKTATPILSATSGILSWVSSTTGVVMPALFPIAADVAASFAGSVNYVELISAIVATSFAAAISHYQQAVRLSCLPILQQKKQLITS